MPQGAVHAKLRWVSVLRSKDLEMAGCKVVQVDEPRSSPCRYVREWLRKSTLTGPFMRAFLPRAGAVSDLMHTYMCLLRGSMIVYRQIDKDGHLTSNLIENPRFSTMLLSIKCLQKNWIQNKGFGSWNA